MLIMLSSFHVQESWIQCCSLSNHGILVGHMTSLFQGSQQLFGGLPGSESSCQFWMLATVHIQRVDDLWQTQPRPQHQCQQCEWASGGGHAVKPVIRAVAYDYPFLHGCMGPRCGHSAIAVCWAPPSHRWTLGRKLNSYIVLLSARRKFCQFPGTAAFPNTRLVTPFPRLTLAVPFMELSL